MARYWGFHHCQIPASELNHYQGKDYKFKDVQVDSRMRVGDYIYLFWANQFLYGWATILRLGQPDANSQREVVLHLHVAHDNLAPFATEIDPNPLFHNFSRLQNEGLSTFDDEQIRHLNMLCQRGGSSPPDPADLREQEASANPLRSVIADFIQGQRLPIEETHFDEFKTITSPKVIERILDELDKYVIGFLNLGDRRYEDFCRVFWGVEDNTSVVVGVPLSEKQKGEIKEQISNKLSRIKPPLASSSYHVKIHPVRELSGSNIVGLFVVEVAVGHGQEGEFYCSETEAFYIRDENVTRQLKGQALIAEINRRARLRMQHASKTPSQPPAASPSLVVFFNNPRVDYNRLQIKNVGTVTALNIQADPVPLNYHRYPGTQIDFRPISHLQSSAQTSLVASYDSFGPPEEQNRSGLHEDPNVSQYLNTGTYLLNFSFTDHAGNPFTETIQMKAGNPTVGPVRPSRA